MCSSATLLYHSSVDSRTNDNDDFTVQIYELLCSRSFHIYNLTNMLLLLRRKVLNASHNTIRFIDNTTFYDAGNLQFLDLSHNQLTKLSRCFTNQPKLDAVKLNNNSLEWISDDAFESLNLSHLDLSCNKLQSGAFLWPSTVNVRFLNLTFNDFVEIDVSLLENISVDLWGEFAFEMMSRKSFFSVFFTTIRFAIRYPFSSPIFIHSILSHGFFGDPSSSETNSSTSWVEKIQYHYWGRRAERERLGLRSHPNILYVVKINKYHSLLFISP